jgi:hypothetical protein
VALYLALVGDPIDGIDGVDGIGKKRAQTLVHAIGDIPLEEAVERVMEDLKYGKAGKCDQFVASLQQTILDRDVPGIPGPGPLVLGDMEVLNRHRVSGSGRSIWARLLGSVQFLDDR